MAAVAGPAGFALSGSYAIAPGRSKSTVWTSRDADRWTRASIGSDVNTAIVLDTGFLAYQSRAGGFFLRQRPVFASLDGSAWEPVTSPTSTSSAPVIASMFRVGSSLVAVTCQHQADGTCSVWSGRLAGSAGSLTVDWQLDAAVSQQLHGHNVTSATGTSNH